jgi:Zinc finger, C2H2 type
MFSAFSSGQNCYEQETSYQDQQAFNEYQIYDKLNTSTFSTDEDKKDASQEFIQSSNEYKTDFSLLATGNEFKQDFLPYPAMLSPPDTPHLMSMGNPSPSPSSSYMTPPGGWGRARAESMSWHPESPVIHRTHQRAMSLPHIGLGQEHVPHIGFEQGQDFGMMQMNFSLPKSFSRKSSISSTCSSSDMNFTCTEPGCDRTFARIQNLRSHARCHLLTTPHNCNDCGLGFRRTTDLQRHVRTMHIPNDQKPWACPRCPKRFGRSDALKRHMASRSKDHGCPGGPDMELLREMEERKKSKAQKRALQTVAE